MKRLLTLTLAAMLVSSCASNPSADSGGCNAVASGGIGALVGAIAGAAIDSHSRGAGAAIGAAAGGAIGALGCLAYNYSTRQKRTAAQVEQQYAQQQGELPQQTQVVRYSAELQPNKAISGGTAATLVSNVELVQGRGAPAPKVEEAVEMRSPDGKVLNHSRKVAQAIQGSGEYENQFKFTLPQGVDEGVYPIDLALYVDGEEKEKRSVRMQVASSGATRILASR